MRLILIIFKILFKDNATPENINISYSIHHYVTKHVVITIFLYIVRNIFVEKKLLSSPYLKLWLK